MLLSLAACTQEELPGNQDKAQQLTFSVTDGGYTSAVRKTTRTVENGCQTKFSEGGACGLYVVRGTQTVYSNVKLTAERDADTGGLVWKTESPTPLTGGLLDEHYYFYYPYQHEPQYWGRAAVRFIITVNELTVPGLSVRSETYTISDNKTCHILESVCP